jgi:hypothetical protein
MDPEPWEQEDETEALERNRLAQETENSEWDDEPDDAAFYDDAND